MYIYIQVIELQELACRTAMYRPKLFSKKDVYTNFTMPIFCASPNSTMSLSFR